MKSGQGLRAYGKLMGVLEISMYIKSDFTIGFCLGLFKLNFRIIKIASQMSFKTYIAFLVKSMCAVVQQ